jgi:two-component system sensor histidine kinase KdpD
VGTPKFQLLHFIWAVGLILLVSTVFLAARPALDTPVIALLYLLPVGYAAAVWGLGPGIAAALVAFLGFNFGFIEPYYTLLVHQPADVVVLVVFLIVAGVISQLVGRAQLGMAAAQAREREATQLYELSTVLAGLQEDEAIARTLAERVMNVVKVDHVEVLVSGEGALAAHHPSDVPSPATPPSLSVPIRAARSEMGAIRVWGTEWELTVPERRLLQTFAGQGALALERARLARAEARAQIVEDSDRLKSAILSSVSHELRTPLSTIKAAATSLRSSGIGWDSQAREDLLSAIDEESDHLNQLVGNLLDMSRLESGALRPQREWNLLSEIVGSVLDRMRRPMEAHDVQVDIPDTLPLVPVDYVQMEQVFTNLLSNSVKFAPPRTAIGIRAAVEGESLSVEVSNEGPAVPEEHLPRIFDKFYRITAADRVAGTGLGLSICKGIIEAHGGRIWAENRPHGFVFRFTVPLTWPGGKPVRPAPEALE